MATSIQITQEDIDNLATKLDEFAQVLNERERGILYALFEMAGKEIQDTLAQKPTPAPTDKPSIPPSSLSAGFRDAFANGVGTKFTILEEEEAEKLKIKASGSGSVKVSN